MRAPLAGSFRPLLAGLISTHDSEESAVGLRGTKPRRNRSSKRIDDSSLQLGQKTCLSGGKRVSREQGLRAKTPNQALGEGHWGRLTSADDTSRHCSLLPIFLTLIRTSLYIPAARVPAMAAVARLCCPQAEGSICGQKTVSVHGRSG